MVNYSFISHKIFSKDIKETNHYVLILSTINYINLFVPVRMLFLSTKTFLLRIVKHFQKRTIFLTVYLLNTYVTW